MKITVTKMIALFLFVSTSAWASPATPVAGSRGPQEELAHLQQRMAGKFAGRVPSQWGENVAGVRTRLKTGEKVIALTLDACGSSRGKGYDAELIDFLKQEQIPAALFISGRWIDANPDLFRQLAENPLFDIANHGFRHRPASVNGRTIYGIGGTASVGEAVEEIELNARTIQSVTGRRPRYYRSGTAYYDEIAVKIAQELGHEVLGFNVLGDAGATFSREKVKAALLHATPGSIVILHMNHPEGETAAGVKAAIPELRKKGYRFVRLGDFPLE